MTLRMIEDRGVIATNEETRAKGIAGKFCKFRLQGQFARVYISMGNNSWKGPYILRAESVQS